MVNETLQILPLYNQFCDDLVPYRDVSFIITLPPSTKFPFPLPTQISSSFYLNRHRRPDYHLIEVTSSRRHRADKRGPMVFPKLGRAACFVIRKGAIFDTGQELQQLPVHSPPPRRKCVASPSSLILLLWTMAFCAVATEPLVCWDQVRTAVGAVMVAILVGHPGLASQRKCVKTRLSGRAKDPKGGGSLPPSVSHFATPCSADARGCLPTWVVSRGRALLG